MGFSDFAHFLEKHPDLMVFLVLGLGYFIGQFKFRGFGLLIAGVLVTRVPQFIGLFIGRYVLRMNPLLLLGALSGAQTMTAALAALQEKSGNPIAVLGYTAAVPFGHILLTSGGTLVVWMLS